MDTPRVLGGALAAQVLLGVLTWWPSGRAVVAPTSLFDGGVEAFTHLEVFGASSDEEAVVLDKADGRWVVTSSGGFPADADKLDDVLDAVAGLRIGSPMATSAASHEALGVTPEARQRKLVVTAGGEPVTLWLGAGGRDTVHLRREGEDAVYRVDGLNPYTLRDTDRSYLPSYLVEYDPKALASFEITTPAGTLRAVREGDGWTFPDDPSLAATEALDTLVEAARRVGLDAVVGPEVAPEHGLDGDGRARVRWTLVGDDEGGSYVLGAEADGKLYARSDSSRFVVKAPTFKLKDVVGVDLATLTRPAAAEAPDAAE